MTYTKKNPRFVWCVGAIDSNFPDIGHDVLNTPGLHLYDRQEKKIVATVSDEYANASCLELNRPGAQPFTDLERWFNRLSKTSLESEIHSRDEIKILIACEFSGVVRRAFLALGHEAWSCDLLPSEDDSPHHIQGDAILALKSYAWELVIAHPPCTYLCNSGVRWLSPGGKIDPDRHKLMVEACDFFAAFYWADVPGVAIENPVMHKYARDYLWNVHKVPTHSQTIQPWQFGHGEVKRTCLWLRGLPLLKPSNIVSGRTPRVHHASPGPNRWKERSRTLPGIAAAMAAQWGIQGAP